MQNCTVLFRTVLMCVWRLPPLDDLTLLPPFVLSLVSFCSISIRTSSLRSSPAQVKGELPSVPSSRSGFHFSQKYRPVNGPERPPPTLHLLSASFRLSSLLNPASSESSLDTAEVSRDGSQSSLGAAVAEYERSRDVGGGEYRGGHGPNGASGRGKVGARDGAVALPRVSQELAGSTGVVANGTIGAASRPSESRSLGAGSGQSMKRRRRIGTYERQRKERDFILRYLRAATLMQRKVGRDGVVTTPSPEGMTARALLMDMRERPWEGEAEKGTPAQWAEWMEHVETVLERHLVWLVVDGLAVRRGHGRDASEARFAAVMPMVGEGEGEAVVGSGGQALSGGYSGVNAGGGAAVARGAGGGESCALGGMRIMKSRPLKMVKPWR